MPSRRNQKNTDSTGQESRYFQWLMDTSRDLVFVLRQGDQITGQLSWYDQHCLKISPSDGSPSLIIPKHNIKYLYERAEAL